MNLVFLLSTLIACGGAPETVMLRGSVHELPYGQGEPLGDISVLARDEDHARTSSSSTASDGSFEVETAAGQNLFLELSGSGRVTTLFAGETGIFDLNVGSDTLFARSEQELASLREEFGECGQVQGGTVVEGEVRIYFGGFEASSLPIANTAWVRALEQDGTSHDACYLDAQGLAAPGALYTGPLGRFAVFGLPPGPALLEVNTGTHGEKDPDTGASEVETWYYEIWGVEGAISPFYPALVEISS